MIMIFLKLQKGSFLLFQVEFFRKKYHMEVYLLQLESKCFLKIVLYDPWISFWRVRIFENDSNFEKLRFSNSCFPKTTSFILSKKKLVQVSHVRKVLM